MSLEGNAIDQKSTNRPSSQFSAIWNLPSKSLMLAYAAIDKYFIGKKYRQKSTAATHSPNFQIPSLFSFFFTKMYHSPLAVNWSFSSSASKPKIVDRYFSGKPRLHFFRPTRIRTRWDDLGIWFRRRRFPASRWFREISWETFPVPAAAAAAADRPRGSVSSAFWVRRWCRTRCREELKIFDA